MSQIAPIQISIVVTILVLIVLFEVLDYYFFRQVFRKKNRPKPFLFLHWTMNGITVLGVLALLFLFKYQNTPTAQQWISVIFTILLAQIWGKFLFLIGSLPKVWLKKPKRQRQFLFIGLFLLVATWTGMGNAVWNTFHPKVRTVEIEIDQLPDSFDGYTIAFLSDLHLGLFSTASNSVSEAVRITNKLHPDLILFGGDLVSLSSEEAFPYTEILSMLNAKDGKFGVRGNHDYGIYNRINSNLKQERKRFSEINDAMGITLLDNQLTYIANGSDTLCLIGTEYYNPQRGFPDGLELAMKKGSFQHPSILLTHNPDHYGASVLGKKPISLTLSGHTHAMQFVISCLGTRLSPSSFLFKHWGGLYEHGKQKLYVNEGFGASLYSIRWGTQSEITRIVLKKIR